VVAEGLAPVGPCGGDSGRVGTPGGAFFSGLCRLRGAGFAATGGAGACRVGEMAGEGAGAGLGVGALGRGVGLGGAGVGGGKVGNSGAFAGRGLGRARGRGGGSGGVVLG